MKRFENWPRSARVAATASVLALGLIWLIHNQALADASMLVFYVLPVALMAVVAPRPWPVVFAVIAGLVTVAAVLPLAAVGWWGALCRTAAFVLVASLIGARRTSAQDMRGLLQQRDSAVAHAIAREQERLGAEVHDGLGSLLAALSLHAQLLEQRLRQREGSEAEFARRLAEGLRATQEQARCIARGLHPMLGAATLPSALRDLCANARNLGCIHCECVVDPDMETTALPLEVGCSLFRISQEAITNAMKHARASAITVELRHGGSEICLTVRDNGCGFEPRQQAAGVGCETSMGLRLMNHHAESVTATLKIESQLGNGSTVTCSFPLGIPAVAFACTERCSSLPA